MASSIQSDTSLWLHNKLGKNPEPLDQFCMGPTPYEYPGEILYYMSFPASVAK